MSEAVKTKKQKKSWFKGLKAEFSKIIWPEVTYKGNHRCIGCIRIIRCNYFSCGLDCSLWN